MDKNITFETLSEKHFSLLLKWLETPHVKKWWDQDIHWTLGLIKEKYDNYVKALTLCPNFTYFLLLFQQSV